MSGNKLRPKLRLSGPKLKPAIKLGKKIDEPGKIKSLADLRRYYHIGPKDWDAIIVTDGSGTGWEKAAGWGSVLFRKGELKGMPFGCAASCGTNNVAEIMAAAWPLLFLSENDYGVKENGYVVHVVSDSQYVVKGIQALEKTGTMWAASTSANRPLWMMILGARRKGLIIRGHYVPRDTIDWNKFCHDLANAARRKMIGIANTVSWDMESILET